MCRSRALVWVGECEPSRWRDGGTSKRDADVKAIVDPSDHADLVQRLQDGRIRGDFERKVIEPLGHTLFWWNGAEDNRAAVNLKIHIGASELGNSVVLNLPYPDAVPALAAGIRNTPRRH
jgi:hypothetical protein